MTTVNKPLRVHRIEPLVQFGPRSVDMPGLSLFGADGVGFRTATTPTQGKSWCGLIDVELIEINLCPRDARWNVLQG
ncbi:hypothetical protein [Rhodanobacter sp. T12-5]|uniref:hypothetical protein n=1 Tax=Rhodanobacter sp. T12-5 TaxID=2024611 RepID=UPI0011EEBC8F|nr:hypothetical protein [Rhodanobacter sp. T12-5]